MAEKGDEGWGGEVRLKVAGGFAFDHRFIRRLLLQTPFSSPLPSSSSS